jgi:hypothetical protein
MLHCIFYVLRAPEEWANYTRNRHGEICSEDWHVSVALSFD